MTRRAIKWGAPGVVVLGIFGMLGACSSAAAPVADGQACLVATDCQAGSVCLPPSCNGGKRVCGQDLTCVVMTEPGTGGTDAAMPMAGEAGAPDGSVGDSPNTSDTAPPVDSGPATDSAQVMDTSAPPLDTSVPDTAPPPDTSVPDTSVPDSAADAPAG